MNRYCWGILFFLFTPFLFSQTSSPAHDKHMYLIPQTLYVGDRGSLVLPLGAAYSEAENIVVTEKNLLPVAPDLVISRMAIETRTGVPRLLVDFQAYAPGILEFPPLAIGSYQFTGLKVTISSILETDGDRLLSDAASPMPVPGTLMLIYGSIIILVIFLLMVIFVCIWGVPYMKILTTQRQRRFVLRALKRSIQKMRHSIAKNTVSGNVLLTHISQDFRSFLSFFTKTDCFSMVPKEFLRLPMMMNPNKLRGGEIYIFEHAGMLRQIFTQCDELRFSGNGYKTENVLQLIDSMSRFAAGFESCEKESPRKSLPSIPGAAS